MHKHIMKCDCINQPAEAAFMQQAMSNVMLFDVGRTTISTTTEVRDRLTAVARSRSTTVSALLEFIASRLEREEALHRVTESYQRFAREDPDGFRQYLAEGQAWDAATAGDGLGSASDEFPELNR